MARTLIKTSPQQGFNPMDALFLSTAAQRAGQEMDTLMAAHTRITLTADTASKSAPPVRVVGKISLFHRDDLLEKKELASREFVLGHHVEESVLVRELIQNCPKL